MAYAPALDLTTLFEVISASFKKNLQYGTLNDMDSSRDHKIRTLGLVT